MPQAILIPALTYGLPAAAAVTGAVLQSRATNKATKASTESNDAALAYAKEQEAIRRADYERALAEWQAGRQALLSRYGVSVPAYSAPRPPTLAAPSSGAPSVAALPAAAREGVRTFFSDGSSPLIPRGQNLAGAVAADAASVQPERWNDWRSYGLPSA